MSLLLRALLLAGLTSVEAVKYGNNHVPVRRDTAVIASAFPDPNVTLLAPAFQKPESIPERFANGSSGPTDQYELGELV
jgi:hypothetical protein